MSRHLTPIDISNMPDLVRIVEEVKSTNQSRVLQQNSEPVAVRIISIHAIVFPLRGEFPFRYKIEVRPPKIMELLRHFCVADDVQFAW